MGTRRTPNTDGANVYVFFKELGLLSYSASGKLRWRAPTDLPINSQGLGASPIRDGNTVLAFGYGYNGAIPFSSQLARKDKNNDGKINRDEYTRADNVLASVADYVGNRDGEVTEDEWIEWGKHIAGGTALVALNLAAPQPAQLWRTDKGFDGVIPSPVLTNGLLYFASEEGKISVVRPGRDWEVLKVNDLNDPFFATPALFCFTAQ